MPVSAPRILLAKVGLDGHDRGIKVLARAFRDAGMEVIYTGLWQTPTSATKAAVEEDVDVLGVSFHSAAHLTLVPIIMQALEQRGRRDIPVVLGGIIPPDDVAAMKEAGVAAVFEPESAMVSILAEVRRLADQARKARADQIARGDLDRWLQGLPRGDRAALARTLTWIENDASARDVRARLPAAKARPVVVGVTGAPGVGKSTLIGQLVRALRGRGKTVAIVAVDPASPITQGALLGDRARMTQAAEDDGVFLRSCASRGALGGVAPSTGTMVEVLATAGFDLLIIETVGAGQNDFTVKEWAAPLVLLLMPGAGDDLQLEKAGITEVADIFVINKADLPGADRLHSQILDALGSGRPIVKTVAKRGTGIDELADAILAHRLAPLRNT